jgi:hypothetical protein
MLTTAGCSVAALPVLAAASARACSPRGTRPRNRILLHRGQRTQRGGMSVSLSHHGLLAVVKLTAAAASSLVSRNRRETDA